MSREDADKDLKVMLGDPRKAVIAMTVPLLFSFLVVQINSFADSSWCSMLGVDSASATATIAPIYWIVSGIGTGLGVGASTAIARHLGARDKESADGMVSQTMAIGIAVGIVFTPILWLLVDPSITFMGADEIRDECMDYIAPIVLCTIAFVLNGAVSGLLRSEGAAKKSTVMLLVAAVLNIVLDPVLMFWLDMGIAGAGWATSISTIVSTAVGLWWYLNGSMYLTMSLRGFSWNIPESKEILSVAVPRTGEFASESAMCMIQRIFIFACAGSSGAALYNIPWKYVVLAEVVSLAIGSAVIPIASAALGQGDLEKADVAYRFGMRLTVLSMTAIAVVLFVFAYEAMIPLTLSESMAEIRPEFAWVLRIYALCIPFMGVLDMASSILQSMQKAQVSFLCVFARDVLTVVLLALTYTISFEAVIYSVLVATVIGMVLMVAMMRVESSKLSRNFAEGRAA